jgi:hypothetical protein
MHRRRDMDTARTFAPLPSSGLSLQAERTKFLSSAPTASSASSPWFAAVARERRPAARPATAVEAPLLAIRRLRVDTRSDTTDYRLVSQPTQMDPCDAPDWTAAGGQGGGRVRARGLVKVGWSRGGGVGGRRARGAKEWDGRRRTAGVGRVGGRRSRKDTGGAGTSGSGSTGVKWVGEAGRAGEGWSRGWGGRSGAGLDRRGTPPGLPRGVKGAGESAGRGGGWARGGQVGGRALASLRSVPKDTGAGWRKSGGAAKRVERGHRGAEAHGPCIGVVVCTV